MASAGHCKAQGVRCVCVQVDDLPVNNPPDLINALDVKELGQTVTLKILRAADNGAQELSVKAVLGSE